MRNVVNVACVRQEKCKKGFHPPISFTPHTRKQHCLQSVADAGVCRVSRCPKKGRANSASDSSHTSFAALARPARRRTNPSGEKSR